MAENKKPEQTLELRLKRAKKIEFNSIDQFFGKNIVIEFIKADRNEIYCQLDSYTGNQLLLKNITHIDLPIISMLEHVKNRINLVLEGRDIYWRGSDSQHINIRTVHKMYELKIRFNYMVR